MTGSRVRLFAPLLFRLCTLVALLLVLGDGASVTAQEAPVDERFGAVDAYRDPNAAVESHVAWERITFDWSQLEPGPDTGLVNAGLEEQWFSDARSASREIVGLLINTPEWATDGRPGIGVPAGLYLPPSNPGNLWANFVRQVVETYARRGVNHWIIWDNPNIPSAVYGNGWEGSIDDYYQMVKVAYIAAKQVNPDAQIHLAGYALTYDAQWLARLMEVMAEDPTAPDNNYYFDAATLHVYYESEQVYRVAQQAFFVMQEEGIGKEIWLVETGAYPPDIALQEYPDVTPDQHAAYVIQAASLALASGIQRVAVNPFVDSQTEDGLLPGLLDPAGGERSAYAAFRVVTEQFADARAASRRELEFAEYVKIRHGDRVTHVVWADSAALALVSIPASTDAATIIDQAGRKQPVTPQDGRYRIRLEAANCNAPNGSCPIGGPVILLVESGIDPFVDPTPSAPVESGPAPTLAPGEATATPAPTETFAPTASPAPAEGEAGSVETGPPTEVAAQPTAPPPTEAPPPTAAPTAGPTPIPAPSTGFAAALPFILVGLGMLVIGGGFGFWLRDRRAASQLSDYDSQEMDSEE